MTHRFHKAEVFCSSAACLAFTLIKVSFEEQQDEPDADDILDVLRDAANRMDVISSFSIAFILYIATLRQPSVAS